eukprot:4651296-Pleurochrysis_carterae.AAC.2
MYRALRPCYWRSKAPALASSRRFSKGCNACAGVDYREPTICAGRVLAAAPLTPRPSCPPPEQARGERIACPKSTPRFPEQHVRNLATST